MLELVKSAGAERTLDRAKWRKPLISIIVTHHNYSAHIEDALRSMLDQSHEHWECVIVDDASDERHRIALQAILARIDSAKIKTVWLRENVGQIPAFFAGLDATTGEFVCPLDPDDRYAESFLEESLAAHLHPGLFCPVVCSDQYLLKDGGVISATTGKRGSLAEREELSFTHANVPGWHWTSTSSLMLRRAALDYLRPHKPIIAAGIVEKRALDAYLAQGAHRLGGSIFIRKALVYRSLHATNAFIANNLCTSFQSSAKTDDRLGAAPELLAYVKECLQVRNAPAIKGTAKTRRHLLAKWKRSLVKRWRKLVR